MARSPTVGEYSIFGNYWNHLRCFSLSFFKSLATWATDPSWTSSWTWIEFFPCFPCVLFNPTVKPAIFSYWIIDHAHSFCLLCLMSRRVLGCQLAQEAKAQLQAMLARGLQILGMDWSWFLKNILPGTISFSITSLGFQWRFWFKCWAWPRAHCSTGISMKPQEMNLGENCPIIVLMVLCKCYKQTVEPLEFFRTPASNIQRLRRPPQWSVATPKPTM